MADKTETLLLQVDVAYNDARLIDLQKQLNTNKQALADLNKSFKDGKVSADEYAKLQVRLGGEARSLRQEQALLTKANETFIKGTTAAAGSIDELRANLSTATKAYNALSQEERDNSSEGQRLQAQTKAISDQLKVLEAAVGDNRRNVGNYTASFAPLIQELVKLQEQQKTVGEGSAEYKKIEREIGFVTKAAQDAGAKAGLSYEQTQAKLREYGEAVRPVVQEVVKLEKEQEQLDEGSEAYTRIGFKLVGLKQKIGEVPTETKKLSSALKDAAGNTSLLSGVTDKYTQAQSQFTQVSNLAKLAIGGNVTALGLLRLALIATGLGALVVVLGSVVVFLTKTAEGSKLLSTVMEQVGAVVNVVVDRIGQLGKAITQVLDGDFKGAAASARAAMSGVGDEIKREITLAGDLSRAQQQLERDERALNVERAKSKAQVESLKLIAEDTTKTTKERVDAARKAFGIELEQEQKAVALQQKRLAIIEAQQKARGGNVSDEDLDKRAEAEQRLSEIQENARTRQIELNNKVNEITNSANTAQAATQAKRDAADKARRAKLDQDFLDSYNQEVELDKLRQDQADKRLEDELKGYALDRQKMEENFQQNIKTLTDYIDYRQGLLDSDLSKNLISQENYNQQSLALERARLERELVLTQKQRKDTAAIEKAIADNTLKENRRVQAEKEKQLDKLRTIEDERIDIGRSAADAVISAFGEESAAGEAAVIAKKALAVIEIGINLERALSNIQVAATGLAATGPVGIATAFAYDATATVAALARAAAATAAVLAFNSGGMVPGAGDTDTVPAMLTPGEVVMNKQASQQFMPLLSYLNAATGGVSFYNTGGVAGMQDGGYGQRALAGTGLVDANAIGQAVAQQLQQANIFVRVTDIEQARGKRVNVRTLSSLKQ